MPTAFVNGVVVVAAVAAPAEIVLIFARRRVALVTVGSCEFDAAPAETCLIRPWCFLSSLRAAQFAQTQIFRGPQCALPTRVVVKLMLALTFFGQLFCSLQLGPLLLCPKGGPTQCLSILACDLCAVALLLDARSLGRLVGLVNDLVCWGLALGFA